MLSINSTKLLTIVGQGVVVGDVGKIEAVISINSDGAGKMMQSALQKGKYHNFVSSPEKIKSIILFSSGAVYTSTYSYRTICERLKRLGVNMFVAIPGQLFLNDSKVESIFEKDAPNTFTMISQTQDAGDYMDVYKSKSDRKEGQRIRSYILFDSGHLYPSTINLKTILKNNSQP